MKLDLQFFGGRGSGSGGWGAPSGSSGANVGIKSTESLISARGERPQEVDQILSAARDIERDYGVTANDLQIATLDKKDANTMGYFDPVAQNMAINVNYMNSDRVNKAYDRGVQYGEHPSRGNKSALESIAYHELGHSVAHKLAGDKWGKEYDNFCNKVVKEAGNTLGYKKFQDFTSKISRYGTKNSSEAIAEAFADVYCNGSNAAKESQAIINTINKYK